MSYHQYCPDTDNTTSDLGQNEQAEQGRRNTTPAVHDAVDLAWRAASVCADNHAVSLQAVTAGIINGASPLQFMDRINVGSRYFGNRAVMQCIGRMQAERRAPDTREIAARGLQGPGQPLTHLADLQRAFGHHDIRGMREHTDSAASSALDVLGAEGYTSSGRMALPGSPDLHVQAHEAAHGVQQAALGNRIQLPGGTGEAGDRYEQQADAVADAVVRGQSAQPILDEMVGYSTQVTPEAVTADAQVQMKWPDKNLEDLTMEEFEAALQQMSDAELDEAWEELTLLIEIMDLENLIAGEVKPKQGSVKKKDKKSKARFTRQEAEARDATAAALPGSPGTETTPQVVTGAKRQKQKQQQKAQVEKGREKGGARKGGKLTLDKMPGLQDMFLSRAVNHLITGELYKLDSMVGDEGCQLRTPFTLDMYELVQEQLNRSPYQSTADTIVSEYRKATDMEQTAVINGMKDLERMRISGCDQQVYEIAVSKFMESNALQASIAAKSGSYQELFTYLMTAMDQSWPGATEYLEYLASETLFWGHRVDPFGVPMMTFKEPIFPDSMLARRKVAQAEYSKNYFVKALSDLLLAKGIDVEAKKVVAGYSKKGEEERLFNIPTSHTESILSMLLYSIQLCTATIPAKNKDLQLIQCWESLRSLAPMMLEKGRPIIINLRRIISSGPEEEPSYSSDLCDSLFYEPTPGGYKYQPEPSLEQQRQGAFVISGFSMLRPGDEKISQGGLNIASWFLEEDPGKFREGFASVNLPNLIFLGGIKHPPLNVGAAGAKALALSPEESAQSTNRTKTREFGRSSENSFPYAEAVHRKVLEYFGQTGMTKAGQKWLSPDYQLTDAANNLVFPDQCPIDITGSRPDSAMNIAEEFQLLLRLAESANLESVRYSMESKETPGEIIRLANQTIPFSIKHIYTSTYHHENSISQRYSASSKRIKTGRRHKISELDRHDH